MTYTHARRPCDRSSLSLTRVDVCSRARELSLITGMDRMIKHSRSAPELMAIAHDDPPASADAAPKRVCLRRSISQCSSLSSSSMQSAGITRSASFGDPASAVTVVLHVEGTAGERERDAGDSHRAALAMRQPASHSALRVLAELVVGADQWDRMKSAQCADGGATTPSTTPRSTHDGDDDGDEPTPPSSVKELPRFSIRFAVPVESSERTSSVAPSDDDVSMTDSTDGPWSGTSEISGEVASP